MGSAGRPRNRPTTASALDETAAVTASARVRRTPHRLATLGTISTTKALTSGQQARTIPVRSAPLSPPARFVISAMSRAKIVSPAASNSRAAAYAVNETRWPTGPAPASPRVCMTGR